MVHVHWMTVPVYLPVLVKSWNIWVVSMAEAGSAGQRLKLVSSAYGESVWNSLSIGVCFISIGHFGVHDMVLFCIH